MSLTTIIRASCRILVFYLIMNARGGTWVPSKCRKVARNLQSCVFWLTNSLKRLVILRNLLIPANQWLTRFSRPSQTSNQIKRLSSNRTKSPHNFLVNSTDLKIKRKKPSTRINSETSTVSLHRALLTRGEKIYRHCKAKHPQVSSK